MSRKYYWLKLSDTFFEDDTIVYLEEQENGKDYIIFYLKLLLKSLNEDGKLIRYVGETLMPYDTKALAKLTNTPVDTVAVAMKVFIEIGLVKQLEAGELYLTQIDEMIGSETSAAQRMRKLRAREKDVELLENNEERNNVRKCYADVQKSDGEIEKEIDIEIDIDKESKKKPKAPRNIIPPTIEMVQEYVDTRNNKINVERFYDYYTSNNWKVGRNKMKDWQASVRNWERNEFGDKRQTVKPKRKPQKEKELTDGERQRILDEIAERSNRG